MVLRFCLSDSAPISINALPAMIRSGVNDHLFGVISKPFLILHPLHSSANGSSSRPQYIRINRLHSGGIDFPLSHAVTVLTLLKQSLAVSSMLNPHLKNRKI